jgi:hypothetical protein
MYGNNHCRTIKAHLRKSLAWARFVAQVQTPVPQKKKKKSFAHKRKQLPE